LQWYRLSRPFLDELVKGFAADAYKRLKTFVGTVFEGREEITKPPCVLVLQDAVTGVQVVLESDLPADSYVQLVNFDLDSIRRGPLHYDRRRRQWRSELDEVYNATSTPRHGS
jgi:hypothetical protein